MNQYFGVIMYLEQLTLKMYNNTELMEALGKMNKTVTKLVLLSVLFATLASAATIYTLNATITTQVSTPNIIFTTGSDTSSIGGSIGASGQTFTATTVPLGLGSNVTVTQAVNITNTDPLASHSITGLTVLSNDFASTLTQLGIYAYNGTRMALLGVDTTGAVVYQFSGSLNMPANDVWSIIIEGCYDAGTSGGTTNTISFSIEQQ